MIPARLYGPGLPVAGAGASLVLSGDTLRVQATVEKVTSLSGLTVTVGGFHHDELFLTWEDADGRWTVHPEGDAGRDAFLAAAPASLQASLGQWRRHTGGQRWVLRGVAALAVLLVVSALLLWWRYDQALDWVTSHISPETERRLGDAALGGLRREQGLVDEGPVVDALRSMGEPLTRGSRYEYRWLVSPDPAVNAYALPGGIVVVNRGLIEKARNADEVAAVLAHEVQHVEQRHSLKGMVNSVGVAAVLMVVLGDASAITAVLAHQAGSMVYGRDLETQADLAGVRAMQKAGLPGQAMVDMLTLLQAENGNGGPEWLSSHPETAARVAAVQAWVKANPCAACKPVAVDWRAVQAGVKVLGKGEE